MNNGTLQAEKEICPETAADNDEDNIQAADDCEPKKVEMHQSPENTAEVEIQMDTEIQWSNNADTISLNNNEGCAPVVPEIPTFSDHLTLGDLTPPIERLLALKLDLPPVGDCLRNWEWLASALGMPGDEIKYLHARVVHPSSPTIVLLRKFKRENLGRVLRIISTQMNRFDVMIELMPLLLALEEGLKLSKVGSKKDSGVQMSNNSSKSTTPVSSLTVSAPNLPGPSTLSVMKTGEIPQNAAPKKDILVLVTYYSDDERQVKNVKWLCQTLKQYFSHVTTDYNVLLKASNDLMTGIDQAFNMATHIIVACSSGYCRFVEKREDVNDIQSASSVESQHVQYARYLYSLMFEEYKNAGCKNRRFRPLIFDQSSSTTDIVVPMFLRSTLVYRWPHDFTTFMNFLYDHCDNNNARD